MAEKESDDILHIGPPVNAAGGRAFYRVKKDGEVETGVANYIPEGEPLQPNQDILKVEHCGPGLAFRVKDEFSTDAKGNRSGPAQVNSEAFKDGWDRIFGSRTVGVA